MALARRPREDPRETVPQAVALIKADGFATLAESSPVIPEHHGAAWGCARNLLERQTREL
jgi:hypothetical protein